MNQDQVLLLWGKLDDRQASYHALLWHLVDAGMVFKTLWDDHLSDSLKIDLSQTLQLNAENTRNLLAFWIALHDIGKAGPAFQQKSPQHSKLLTEAGLTFPPNLTRTQGNHSLATTWIMRNHLKNKYPGKIRFSNAIAITLGGHHGEFPLNQNILSTAFQTDHLGGSDWETLRGRIVEILERIFSPPEQFNMMDQGSELNAMCLLLAGLTTTADWIASNELYFPYDAGTKSIDTYTQESLNLAEQALKELGWGVCQADEKELDFADILCGESPHPIQKAFIEHTRNLKSPYLVILEAPTGSGKTESAYWLADATLQKDHKAGFYIAMPTQATSNQMFQRTLEFLEKRYPQQPLNVRLVHGAALMNELYEKTRFSAINQDSTDEYAGITSQDWFLPRKRSLLAPFGIGTVDQTLMGVLRSRHFFLRLFGLSHKVVIFDEVHAYDVYMLEIFKRLLGWLRMLHVSVIILTATLPAVSRKEMVSAFSGKQMDLYEEAFPRVTVCAQNETAVACLGEQKNTTIQLNWLGDGQIEPYLQEKLAAGGNAAIIVNRVKRAQEVYERAIRIFPKDEVKIFHSRYPHCRRAEIEEEITKAYGKDLSKRPYRSIVIATQVIEQSLDLDFDSMISDLAPIDLIIQRIGRLQRHKRIDKAHERPPALSHAALALIKPNHGEQDFPDFGDDTYIYDRYLLERTFFAIREKAEFNLPLQTDTLIEAVYSDQYLDFIPNEFWPQMQQHYEELIRRNVANELKAQNQLIPEHTQNLLGSVCSTFRDEHDLTSHNIVKAVTRNTRPSVNLVCLQENSRGIFTLSGNYPIDLKRAPDKNTVKACLSSALSVSHPAVVQHFFSMQAPAGWKRNAALRTHYPLVLKENRYDYGAGVLTLDQDRGLLISKKEGSE